MGTRIPLLLAAAGLALAAAAPPAGAGTSAAKPRSCASGHTLYRHGRTRLFYTQRPGQGSAPKSFYVCSARLRHPVRYWREDPEAQYDYADFRRFGARRIGFRLEVTGPMSFEAGAGWVDTTTGTYRDTAADQSGYGIGADLDYAISDYALATDGGIALAVDPESGPDRIAYASAGTRRLHAPRVVATLADGDPEASGSLAVAAGNVSWTTASGAQGIARVRR